MGYVGSALAKQSVHEGGLAVVDVGDHRHVTQTTGIKGAVDERGSGRGGSGGGEGG